MEEGEGNEALQMGSLSVSELWRSSDRQHVLSHNVIFLVWVWECISIIFYVHNIVFFCLCAAMETGCPPSPRGSVHGIIVPEGLGYNAVM